MSKIDIYMKAMDYWTVPVAERTDLEAFLSNYTETVLHKEYKEYHIDGKILTREDAKEMMRSMKDMVLLQSFISDWKVLSEDETTVVIERGDSEDPTIRRRDQYTFKDGLVIERRCLA